MFLSPRTLFGVRWVQALSTNVQQQQERQIETDTRREAEGGREGVQNGRCMNTSEKKNKKTNKTKALSVAYK